MCGGLASFAVTVTGCSQLVANQCGYFNVPHDTWAATFGDASTSYVPRTADVKQCRNGGVIYHGRISFRRLTSWDQDSSSFRTEENVSGHRVTTHPGYPSGSWVTESQRIR